MAQEKFDGVIEAVRYSPEGAVSQVRMYERRGPTWSDCVLLDRAELVRRMKAGKRIAVGRRQTYLGSSFEVKGAVHLAGEILATTADAHQDNLEPAPLF